MRIYPDLKNVTAVARTDQDKLKQLVYQLNSVFATKIELKALHLRGEIGNFLILNVQNYAPFKIFDDHEEFMSLNESDKIVNNLYIKKASGIDQIKNKLIKYIKPGLIKLFHFLFNLCTNFGIHPFKLENRDSDYAI